MAATTRKRQAEGSLEGSTKRLRIDTSNSNSETFEESEEEEALDREEEDDFSGDDAGQGIDTPTTPFSPAPLRAKFPSEYKTIKCTWEGCTKTFNRPARLEAHLRSHTNERPFVCTYEGCDKSYMQEKHLTQHIKGSHKHERSYSCDFPGCTKSFLTATRLKRHKAAHEGHERFRCTAYPPCNQTFRKHQTLQRHIRSDHLELAPYPCTMLDLITGTVCQAGFDGPGGLRKHIERAHSNRSLFYCSECFVLDQYNADGSPVQLSFPSQAKLDIHIRKEHAHCPFCDRKFTSSREIQAHIESQHSGIPLEARKKVPCTFPGCTKTFTKKSNLTVHIKTTHNGERFICGTYDVSSTVDIVEFDPETEGCGKDFVSKANLEDHVRTAHCGLPSLINANRKKHPASATQLINDDDDDLDDQSYEAPRTRSAISKKQKPSIIGQLTGLDARRTISCGIPLCQKTFIREYDRHVHLKTKHRLSDQEIEQLPKELLHDDFEIPDLSMGQSHVFGSAGQGMDTGMGMGMREMAGNEYDQNDIDWELQRQALEGGPFWIGADNHAQHAYQPRMQMQEEWIQDEYEMRTLIDEAGFVPQY